MRFVFWVGAPGQGFEASWASWELSLKPKPHPAAVSPVGLEIFWAK